MRERAARAAAALLTLLVPLACTRVGDAPAGGLHAWTQTDRVRIGSTEEPETLDPILTISDAANQVETLLFAPPLRVDDRGDFQPELARVVPTLQNGGISRDGRTIVLHLRPGLRWSDGAPLDGRDLRFTWRAVMNPRNNVPLRNGWDDIAGIDLPDRSTVVVHLREPYAPILQVFAVPPLPEHLLGALPDLNQAAFNQHPISNGPYVLTRWDHGSSLELTANPAYWRGAPAIAHVSYRIIADADTMFNALLAHEIDVVDTLGENQTDRVAALSGYTIRKRLVANWRHVDMNCAKPALRDVRVRRAIAEAVDWERIDATVYHGTNVRAVSDILPTSWAAPHLPGVRYDPADAKRLLAAAGWLPGADGIRRRAGVALDLDVSSTNAKPANVQAEIQMQHQLLAAGIRLGIKNYPTSLLFAPDGPLYGGRYDLSLTIGVNGPDPDNEHTWSATAIPPHGENTTFLADPIITQTAHAAARTFDRAARRALYQREEERIAALVPAVFLYWQVAYAVVNSDLRHYRPAQVLSSNWNAWQWTY